MMPVHNNENTETRASSWSNNIPHVTIIEQPRQMLRFRYECERRCAGKIFGENYRPERKTFPTIQIHNYQGPAFIVVSCVTRDDPPKPHPHCINGPNSPTNGVYLSKVNIDDDGLVSFARFTIECKRKNQVLNALEVRKRDNVDPFGTGFDHMNFPDSLDLNSVRLCFQVFIPGPENKFNVPLRPLVTNAIYDSKTTEGLVICKLSTYCAPVSGGTEVILLCSKIDHAEDIQIRFFEERNGRLFWENFGHFNKANVHKQAAIVFKTPAYADRNVSEPVEVCIQLRRKSNGFRSDAVPFLMLPEEIDEIDELRRKRPRFDFSSRIETENRNPADQSSNFPDQHSGSSPIPLHILNVHCDRTIHETFGTPVPQPRTSLAKKDPPPKAKEGKTKASRKRTTPKARIRKELEKTNSEGPRPQPRRRFGTLPPNVTMTPPPNVTMHNSYAYEDTLPGQSQNLDVYSQFSHQQQRQEMSDPFAVGGDLPSCDFQPRVLAEFEPFAQNVENTDAILDELSRDLPMFDEVQDAFRNIHELNRNIQEGQQCNGGKYMTNYFGNEASANDDSTWNDIFGQEYDDQLGGNNFF